MAAPMGAGGEAQPGGARGTHPLRVAVVGATDRVRERFAGLFEGLGRGACILVDPPAAEALVVDLDHEGAWAAWQAYRVQAPGTPVVLIGSDAARFPPHHTCLLKPLDPGRLLAALAAVGSPPPATARAAEHHGTTEVLDPGERPPFEHTVALAPRAGPDPLTERVASRSALGETPSASDLCGHADDVDLDDSRAVTRLFIAVEERLLGACRAAASRAADTGQAWAVRLAAGGVRLEPAGGAVRCELPAHALRELCQLESSPAGGIRVAPAGSPEDRVRAGGVVRSGWESTEACLWQLALWTYRGRLPAGTGVHGRVFLSRWPNLTRLAETPHALRIAGLWLAQPVSLAYTVEALAIPQRYVFAFYGAAHAAGLAGQARRAADHLFAPGALASEEARAGLGSVAARLKGLVGR